MREAILCMAVTVAISASAVAQPNFVIILSDDQSWVGSSVQMDPRDSRSRSDYLRTPALEKLAREGMTFTDGYAPAPFCCPTRRSLQVGQTPARHMYHRDQESWPSAYLKQASIPSVLKAADPRYRLAHFGKWDYRFDMPTPEDVGYDSSDGYTGNGTGGAKGTGGPAAREDPKLTGHVTRRACEFLKEQAASGTPFYLQVSHYAVHLDIYYRQETLQRVLAWVPGKKHYSPPFAAMTADMDAAVGRVVDCLDRLGLAESTYVIFLSDNGGRATIPGAGDPRVQRNHPLRGSKGSMYEGGIRVPFIVRGPHVKPGSVNRTAVTGLDILPTVADLAGHKGPLPASVDGGSLRNVLAGGSEVARNRDFLVFHQAVTRRAQSALRIGEWKLVKTWGADRVELFDLSRDIGETRDLSGREPARTGRLDAILTRFLADVEAETRKTDD